MNKKNKLILKELSRDSSSTTRKIAKNTLIPITTVHKRKNKLIADGIIKKFGIEIDYDRVGLHLSSFVLASINNRQMIENKLDYPTFCKKLVSLDYIEKAFHVTGLADLVLLMRVKDTRDYEDKIYDLKKRFSIINNTNSMIILSEY